MGNYYWEPGYADEEVSELASTYFGALLFFMLDTLIVNRNGGLDAEDVAYLTKVRSAAGARRTTKAVAHRRRERVLDPIARHPTTVDDPDDD